jgi:hypothetical protein
MTDFSKKSETLWDNFLNAASELAQEMFREVVKPFCDKHKLKFVTGMGSYSRMGNVYR